MKTSFKFFTIIILLGSANVLKAQQGFGTNNPDKSSVIDMVASNKGVLMPRVALTDINDIITVPFRSHSLTVFNTATAGTAPNNVTPGYYYWNQDSVTPANSKWVRLAAASDIQEPWYNQATNSGATANTQNIYQMGQVGINTTTPVGQLHVVNPTYALQSVFERTNTGLINGIAAGTTQFLYNTLTSSIASYIGSGVGKGAPYNGMSVGYNFAFKSNTDAIKDIAAINAGLVDYVNGKGQLNFIVNGSGTTVPSMVLASNGYLGIGTVTTATPNNPPTNALHVKATSNPVRFEGLQTGAASDNVVVADATGVLKTVTATSLTPATTNTLTAINGNLVSTVNSTASTPAVPVLISASNGLTATNGDVKLGGALTTVGATTITASAANTLAIAGLQAGAASDKIVVADPTTGVLKTVTSASLIPATTNTLTATNGNLVSTVNGTATTPAVPVLIGASNGLTATNGDVKLGGALTTVGATTITASAANTLAIAGLQAGAASDKIVVADPTTGVLKTVTSASLIPATTNTLTATNGNLVSTVNGTATTPAVPVLISASNGLTATNGDVKLGGALTNVGATTITASAANTLAIAGLQAGTASDKIVVADPTTGVLKTVTSASLIPATTNTLTATNGNLVSTVNGTASTPAVPVLISASNGLTATNGDVKLGGTLAVATTIVTNSPAAATLAITGLQTGTGTDKIVVADPTTGVLKTVATSSVAIEPWQVQGGITQATANGQNIYQNGSVAIGIASGTAIPAAEVTATNPKLYVEGNVTITGKYYTTNSVYADYVFEKYFNGSSTIDPNYKFKSLNEIEAFVKANKHLPGVTPITGANKTKNGYAFDLTALSIQSLEKIEELYLHVIELNGKVNQKDQEIKALQEKTKTLEERLNRLEQLIDQK